MKDIHDVVSFGELYKALYKCKKGVMWKDSVAGHVINGLKNTYKLKRDLVSKKYKISKYQCFKIYEPKERVILATRIKDRQFQRSLCDNVLYPALTNSFIRDNCACQKYRGVDDALNRMKYHLHSYFINHGKDGYVLKCDIHHFFPNTNHEVAKSLIRKMVKDEESANYVCDIIDSFDGDCGIGLGSQTSQLIELAMLNGLDHYIKEHLHIKYYIRYMDDFILIDKSNEHLKYCLDEIKNELSAIKLKLNPKTSIFPIKQGINFLKWKYYLTDTGKVIMRMSKRSIIKERRKLKKLKTMLSLGKITMDDVQNNYQSWQANAKRGNTFGVIKEMQALYDNLFKGVNEHVRNDKATII